LLDLSSIQTIVSDFNDASTTVRANWILASDNGQINLSGAVAIVTPARGEDRLDLNISTDARLDLSSLDRISGGGQADFNLSGGGEVVLGSLSIGASTDFRVSTGATLQAADLLDDPDVTRTSSITLSNADVTFDIIGTLDLGRDISLYANAESETKLGIGRNFLHELTDPARMHLETAIVEFDGTDPQFVEVGGIDGDVVRPGADNFAMAQMVVGQTGQSTAVRLVNRTSNMDPAEDVEALYLLGLDPATSEPSASGLRILGGSTLSLGCTTVYVFSDNAASFAERLNDRFGPGDYDPEPYDGGWVALDDDFDGDGIPDCVDNCVRKYNPLQEDANGDEVGDACDVKLDLDDDAVTDKVQGLELGSETGAAVAKAGDLDGDGIKDFLVGAPGYEEGGGPVETGAVGVYLGSDVKAELIAPDIVFVGEEAHDRAGVAIAGDFDFNGDGIPDILIGVEQVDRTDGDGNPDNDPAVGAGKVYLIYFDPADYPNLGDPGTTDFIDLSRVGSGLADEIPGVVFTGVEIGDMVGFAVDGGGRVDPGAGQDIAIGAPGRDNGAEADAGTVYVIFDDPNLSGAISLDRVANGLGDEIDGVVYLGTVGGDRLGHSVSFPGDVIGSSRDDLAMGAPYADTWVPGAGIVYVVEGGDLLREIEEVDPIGGDTFLDPGAIPGAQIWGTQADELFGWSAAGGGDNLVNGQADLLIGAPSYDVVDDPARADVGRVVQFASKLPFGYIDADLVGAPANEPGSQPGAVWVGDQAGDGLGTAVAGLGDVTGNGFDDVALGAPYADVDGAADAGYVYLVPGWIPPTFHLGVIDLAKGFPGIILTGAEADEYAGSSLAGVGDVNDDGSNDFLVGAPGKDAVSLGDDAGLVYIVTDVPCGTDDTDGDGIPDCEDVCPGVYDPGQDDTDKDGPDGVGDACDICPDANNPGQEDLDNDGTGDLCDNCPDVNNPSQSDTDDDGVGEACDDNPRFTVSSDVNENPDFTSIQQAVDEAGQSGTRIEIHPGLGTDYDCVVVDRNQVFRFVGIDDGSGVAPVIDCPGSAALEFRSTKDAFPITVRNLTLQGKYGILVRPDAGVSSRIEDVDFRNITDTAMDLQSGDHQVSEVTLDASVNNGINLGAIATLGLDRSTFDGLGGTAMVIDGGAVVENVVVVLSVGAIEIGSAGSLDLSHSTVADNVGPGVDNSLGGSVTIAHTILQGNGPDDTVGVLCSEVSWSNVGLPDCSAVGDNLNVDCEFEVPGTDYQLASTSVCLDHGPDPALFDGTPRYDREGNVRVYDHDGDGYARFDIGAYERENTDLVPGDVTLERWLDKQTLPWLAEPSAVEYHVYHDTLDSLGYDWFGTCRDDLDGDRTDTELTVSDDPASGVGWFYLISAEDALGEEGSLGMAAATERSNFAPCP
jgi:hypothetical protein